MYQRILVPIDGSDTSTKGLDEAIALAKLTGGRLRIFHAIDDLSMATGYESYAVYAGDMLPLLKARGEKLLEEAKARSAVAGVDAETVLRETAAERLCDLVVEQARRYSAELIVIGTHGRRGFGRLLMGSDAEQIVRISTVPVLLVRSAQVAAAEPATQSATTAVTATATATAPTEATKSANETVAA